MGPIDVQIGTTDARTKHPSHCTQTQKQTLGNNNQVARAGHAQVRGLQDLKGFMLQDYVHNVPKWHQKIQKGVKDHPLSG